MRPSTLRRLGGILVLLSGACARPTQLPATIPPARGEPRVAYALRVLDLAEGSGAVAEERKCLYVHYAGWLTDGRKFTDSRDTLPGRQPGRPFGFPYGRDVVNTGWDRGGFDGMRVGGRRRLFIPHQLGYGSRWEGPTLPLADVVMDVELMAVADTVPRVDTRPARREADLAPRCAAWEDLRRGS